MSNQKTKHSTFPFNVKPTQSNTKSVNKEQKLRELKQRETELLIAKSKLERNLAIKRKETELACRVAKKQAQKEVLTQIEKVLPNTMIGNYPVSARVLAKDIKKVLKEYE